MLACNSSFMGVKPATRGVPISSSRLGAQRLCVTAAQAPKRGTAKFLGAKPKPSSARQPGTFKKAQANTDDEKALTAKRQWNLWYALPLAPYNVRPTVFREAIRGKIYMLEQSQGVLNVLVNIRTVVVVLKEGGLWVHNPLAPTKEYMEYIRMLEKKHGKVKYIVLGTTQVEHKVYLGPVARKFPDAEIYVAPTQWSWPINLPIELLGLFPRRISGILADTFDGGKFPGEPAPFSSEFEQAVISVPQKLGPFTEVAFMHKPTRTLICTDAFQYVPVDPPEVLPVKSLLIRARDAPGKVLKDTRASRRQGWAKTILFGLYFFPGAVKPAIYDDGPIPNVEDGFKWNDSWKESFRKTSQKLFVPPILQVLYFNRSPDDVMAWAQTLAKWDPQRVIPAHLAGPVKCTGRSLLSAVQTALTPGKTSPYPKDDIRWLEEFDTEFESQGLTSPTAINSRVNDMSKPGVYF